MDKFTSFESSVNTRVIFYILSMNYHFAILSEIFEFRELRITYNLYARKCIAFLLV